MFPTESPRCVDASYVTEQMDVHSCNTVSMEVASMTQIDSSEIECCGTDSRAARLWDANSNVTNGIFFASGEEFLRNESNLDDIGIESSFQSLEDALESNCQQENCILQPTSPWECTWHSQS
ncbi:hypothetical protein GUITHDRAFT_102756 [Guillardia theta CCMP2712]|uniref:Uncharacterized protein n=1 Tax=Guillardia theta (strain CCMP2712) TaxID=905079 RepID=L1JTT1_GUITC|nr:hypothetical protein GUITHDRAFT_102756 [Guillardia theta CCMP2712]EKX51488.1 hypothetical protein GUITHDRAFT_102756 [Guillardia theta CCMP2712]|eukprot:XP_005838468.1 hypothetical protein GUITHDRAFT_102756 [Guillardia theta CCMP2712]